MLPRSRPRSQERSSPRSQPRGPSRASYGVGRPSESRLGHLRTMGRGSRRRGGSTLRAPFTLNLSRWPRGRKGYSMAGLTVTLAPKTAAAGGVPVRWRKVIAWLCCSVGHAAPEPPAAYDPVHPPSPPPKHSLSSRRWAGAEIRVVLTLPQPPAFGRPRDRRAHDRPGRRACGQCDRVVPASYADGMCGGIRRLGQAPTGTARAARGNVTGPGQNAGPGACTSGMAHGRGPRAGRLGFARNG